METTKKIFGTNVFECSEHETKNKLAHTENVLGLIESNEDANTKHAYAIINKDWRIQNTMSQAFDIEAYNGHDYFFKRDVFNYAFNRAEDGMLLSDDKGNVLGAFKIDCDRRLIECKMHNALYICLTITDSKSPGAMLDSILLESGAKTLYATAFTYANVR